MKTLYLSAAFLLASSLSAAERVPWTTSRIVGSPDPPKEYHVERVYPELEFDQPVELMPLADTGKMMILEVTGKLYTFDVVGGRYEERDYATTGSGGGEAKAFLKASYRPDLDEAGAVGLAVEALVAAAEEDAATGGPDLRLGIFPNVVTVTAAGFAESADETLAAVATEVMEGRPR